MNLTKWMAAGLVCCAALGQNGTSIKDVEWPSYAADTHGTGYRPIALNAKTGAVIPTFGTGGAVDLKQDIDQTIMPDLTTGEIGIQSAPVVAGNTIIIGAAFREGMTPKTMRNNKGYVRGFDV